MEVDTSGIFTTDKVYGYPFAQPKVVINSHTPLDEENEEDDEAVTLKDFVGKRKKFVYEKQDEENEKKTFGIDNGYKPPSVELTPEKPEFPPKSIKGFSASQISSDAVVKKAIGNGFSTDKAIATAKAQKAYGLQDPLGNLGNKKVNG